MKGVVTFIKQAEGQDISLVFNDVTATSESDNPNWRHDAQFTFNNYNENELKDMSLSKEQYAEIGENLILRLLAINGLLNENT